MKLSKLLTKAVALTVVVATLASATLFAAKLNYSDVPENHWAYESISAVTEAGLMVGKVENEIFSKDDRVTISEILSTLYRLSGNEKIPESFSSTVYFGIPSSEGSSECSKWYAAPWKWALYNGVAQAHSDGYSRYKHSESSDVRRIDVYDFKLLEDATRADVILALYYYVNTYMEREINDSYDLSVFPDWRYDEAYPQNVDPENDTLDVFNDGFPRGQFTNIYSPSALDIINATEWAVSNGIIVGYPDGTIGIQDVKLYWDPLGFGENVDYVWHEIRDLKYVTRAEYAAILDRFMDYCENLK